MVYSLPASPADKFTCFRLFVAIPVKDCVMACHWITDFNRVRKQRTATDWRCIIFLTASGPIYIWAWQVHIFLGSSHFADHLPKWANEETNDKSCFALSQPQGNLISLISCIYFRLIHLDSLSNHFLPPISLSLSLSLVKESKVPHFRLSILYSSNKSDNLSISLQMLRDVGVCGCMCVCVCVCV